MRGGSIWRTEKSRVAEGNQVLSLGSRSVDRVIWFSLVSLYRIKIAETPFNLVLFSV